MSTLTYIEKRKLEKLFYMESGYILDFSNDTFGDFVKSSLRIDIYSPKYSYRSSSKANLLRGLWENEPDHIVAKLLCDLLDYKRTVGIKEDEIELYKECKQISERISQTTPIVEDDVLERLVYERDFAELARMVRASIEEGAPETGLDRLHTFTVKFFRKICSNRGLNPQQGKPLHSLVGEYIKVVKDAGFLESEMAERILKSSISVLEAYNKVRNDHSYAHDNKILSSEESRLIMSHVTATIRFVNSIETAIDKVTKESVAVDFCDDIPW